MLLVSFIIFFTYGEVLTYSFVSFSCNGLNSTQNGRFYYTRLFESIISSSEIPVPVNFLFTSTGNVCHVYTSHLCHLLVNIPKLNSVLQS